MTWSSCCRGTCKVLTTLSPSMKVPSFLSMYSTLLYVWLLVRFDSSNIETFSNVRRSSDSDVAIDVGFDNGERTIKWLVKLAQDSRAPNQNLVTRLVIKTAALLI